VSIRQEINFQHNSIPVITLTYLFLENKGFH